MVLLKLSLKLELKAKLNIFVHLPLKVLSILFIAMLAHTISNDYVYNVTWKSLSRLCIGCKFCCLKTGVVVRFFCDSFCPFSEPSSKRLTTFVANSHASLLSAA